MHFLRTKSLFLLVLELHPTTLENNFPKEHNTQNSPTGRAILFTLIFGKQTLVWLLQEGSTSKILGHICVLISGKKYECSTSFA